MSKGNHALQPIKVKDFQKFMKERGFYLDRKNGDHYIWMNDHNETISVAYQGKEVNPMMWKLIQQRLKRGLLIKTIPQHQNVKTRVFLLKTWNIKLQEELLLRKPKMKQPITLG